jgi:hypothetical protein
MKNEPSETLRQVWTMKQAAEEETRGCATAAEYFSHIRSRIPEKRLPDAVPPRTAAASRTRRDTH